MIDEVVENFDLDEFVATHPDLAAKHAAAVAEVRRVKEGGRATNVTTVATINLISHARRAVQNARKLAARNQD